MKNNKVKNNLDEMQEQKLLQIEHNCCWFAFWALFISLVVQMIISDNMLQYMIGELIVFMGLCVYLCVACIRNGIWDRQLNADPKTNLIASIVAGLIMAVIMFIMAYRRSGMPVGSICAGIFTGGLVFALCLIIFTISASVYKKRVDELEKEVETE